MGGGMGEMMKGMMSPSAPAAPLQPATAAEGAMPPAPAPATAPAAMGAVGIGGAGIGGAGIGGAGMGGAGMGGAGMGGGGCCGGGGAKPFYPALMDMPTLTPEARQFIEAEAGRRLGTGTEQITTSQAELHHALSMSDGAAVQLAVAGVRRGLFLVESGASAEQAMGEGQPPPRIALTWFKAQASVPVAAGMSMDEGPWGLSWYHVTLMLFLIAFLAAALAIHFARTRRVAGLVERLGAGGVTPPDKPAGPAAGGAKPAALAAKAAKPAAPAAEAAKSASPRVAAPAAAATPVKPAADAPKKPWSGALRVAAIFRETPTVKTFRLIEADGGHIPFTFLPGQFLTFSAEIDGKPIKRSYTIPSSPMQCGYVEITVKREEQGAESRYLHDCVAVGDSLNVSGPSGVFTFTGKEAASIVLIGGGVGITPMMCIIRHLTDRAYPGEIFFLYGARSPEEYIFCEELHYLQKRHANLHVTAVMAHAEGTKWTGATGNITKDFIAHAVPEIARRRVHVCGPPPMMEAVKAELVELGVPKDKIKTEAFGPALGAAPAPAAKAPAAAPAAKPPEPTPEGADPDAKPVEPSPAEAEPGAAPAAAAAAAAASAQVEVEFSKSGKTGPLAPDQSVLEAAEAIGVSIDFSCRVGTCGTCVVPLTSGTVTMAVEEGLPPDQKAKGIILACQAMSVGPLVVDA